MHTLEVEEEENEKIYIFIYACVYIFKTVNFLNILEIYPHIYRLIFK